MNVVILGAGNVATHFGMLLKKGRHQIVQVYDRTPSKGRALAGKLKSTAVSDIGKLHPDADAYLVALSDDAIKPVLKKFRFIPALIVHTSGSVPLSVFPAGMKSCGVIYPVQTLALKAGKPAEIPLSIEASGKAAERSIKQLAKSISPTIYMMNSAERKRVHLAAVFANNFPNHLFYLAEIMLTGNKLSREILHPLILATAKNAVEGNPEKVQTGPARRGDKNIMRTHLKMLEKHPEERKIYRLLSKSIAR